MTAKVEKTPSLYDVRSVKRNLKKEYLTNEEYQKYLDSLPDAQEKAEPIGVDQAEEILEREQKRQASLPAEESNNSATGAES